MLKVFFVLIPSGYRLTHKKSQNAIECILSNLLCDSLYLIFFCRDQSFTTAVTTSTFPNMHTFLSGPEFCFMVRKLFSSCQTSKNLTLEEQYPFLCLYLSTFPDLCQNNFVASMVENHDNIDLNTTNQTMDVLAVLLSSTNDTKKAYGFK